MVQVELCDDYSIGGTTTINVRHVHPTPITYSDFAGTYVRVINTLAGDSGMNNNVVGRVTAILPNVDPNSVDHHIDETIDGTHLVSNCLSTLQDVYCVDGIPSLSGDDRHIRYITGGIKGDYSINDVGDGSWPHGQFTEQLFIETLGEDIQYPINHV